MSSLLRCGENDSLVNKGGSDALVAVLTVRRPKIERKTNKQKKTISKNNNVCQRFIILIRSQASGDTTHGTILNVALISFDSYGKGVIRQCVFIKSGVTRCSFV